MGFRGLIKEKYVNEMAALLSDTLTSLYCMEAGIVSQCRGLSRGSWGLLFRRVGGQRKSQVMDGMSENSRGAALAWGLYGPGLSYLLLTDAGEVS